MCVYVCVCVCVRARARAPAIRREAVCSVYNFAHGTYNFHVCRWHSATGNGIGYSTVYGLAAKRATDAHPQHADVHP